MKLYRHRRVDACYAHDKFCAYWCLICLDIHSQAESYFSLYKLIEKLNLSQTDAIRKLELNATKEIKQ